MEVSFPMVVCDTMKRDNATSAQTERRGGAGPVRGLLGGKDLTGRFYSTIQMIKKSALLVSDP
jgi:hypothetical protein